MTKGDMGIRQCFFLVLATTAFNVLIGNTQTDNEELYPIPRDCYLLRWNGPNPNDVYLICTIGPVHKDTPFEILTTKHLLGLYMNCTSIPISSSLQPNALSHLYFLQELFFSKCHFQNLPSEALQNLTSLRSLIIENTLLPLQSSPPGLRLPSDFLINNSHLNKVYLVNNGIESLPPTLFCSSPRINLISLAGNRLRSFNDIGCGKDSQCCLNLEGLNISQNMISELRKEQLAPLVQLMELDFHHNAINVVEEGIFDAALNLTYLDLSDNQLTFLPAKLLHNNLNLQQLGVAKNYLIEVSPEFCCNKFRFLLYIDVSENNLTALSTEMFSNSEALLSAKFSYNAFQFIHYDIFDTLHNISQLSMDYCQIEHLPDGTFRNTNTLVILLLNNNNLMSVSHGMLQGLEQLIILDLSGNSITSIHDEAFIHCPLLQYLFLRDNKIINIPIVSMLNNIAVLDLGQNEIRKIDAAICTLGQSGLQYLDLSHNHINTVSSRAFNVCLALETLLLNNNKFISFDKRITHRLRSLQSLNLSQNHLWHFDYNWIPDGLQLLDISYNQINQTLNDAQHRVTNLHMKTLIAHHNQIEFLTSRCLPTNIEFVDLSYNTIQHLGGSIFSPLMDLKVVDLSNNFLDDLEEESFTLRPSRTLAQTLPIVNLQGNMPKCTCKLWWLMNKYVLGKREYVEIVKPYYCRATHERVKQFKALITLEFPSDILNKTLVCPYTNDFSPPCVNGCMCYHDAYQNNIEIDCGQKTWNAQSSAEPIMLPTKTKRLFLDGNTNLQIVANTILKNIPLLNILFMNGSRIEALNHTQFEELHELEELHLENNLISQISDIQFDNLFKLRKLFLHANRIKTVNMQAFTMLKHLQVVTLHLNQLHELKATNITFDITLRENPFECACEFQTTIQLWTRYIVDLTQTECVDTHTNTRFSATNFTFCEEEASEKLYHSKTTIVLSVVCGLLFVMISAILIIYVYRYEMQVWVYSRYGVRFFYHNADQDENKQFDAFISYSSDDGEFVANELVPHLERDAGFRLCIHQRDFPVGGFIADTIVEVVEKSCRTLMVLTNNFVASEWCRFEFKMAHHRSMQDRCCRLIVIILEDVDSSLMDKELKLYLQTNTYLRWGDKLFWEKLLFAMPNRQPLKDEL